VNDEPAIPSGPAGSASPNLVAQGYDAVYAAIPSSPTLLRIWKEHASGPDYPDDFYHISFLTLAELRRLATDLRLSPGMTFADLACGMGGPGLWLARETGANLIGIDLSEVGVLQATRRAEALGLSGTTRFATGAFEQTGIPTATVDAVMSVDALQYSPDKRGAFEEICRIMRPSGRLAFTAFEVDAERSAGLPVIGVDTVADYRPLLEHTGFRVLAYEETAGWRERLTDAYEAVIREQHTLRNEMGPLAVAALLSEVTVTLERELYRRRVFVVAERALP
jgi:ubiquinone/menaquinone biosynthesis C-methylase UbiE